MQHIPLDKKVLGQWLKSGYIDNQRWFPTESGTPQGGLISPTIANMVLDGLEKVIKQYANHKPNKNPHKINFIRYADDFVVTGSCKEYLDNEIKPLIGRFLAERGLSLSEEKTKITHINQGFDFLGFNIRKYNGKCLTKPSKDSIKSIYSSIRECVNNHKAVKQEELIRMIAPKIVGWANFFRHSAAKNIFSRLDNKVFKLLWKWAIRRHPNKSCKWVKAKYFKTIGSRIWVFSPTDKTLKKALPLFDATKIVRHTKIRKHAHPYDREWDIYFLERDKRKTAKWCFSE